MSVLFESAIEDHLEEEFIVEPHIQDHSRAGHFFQGGPIFIHFIVVLWIYFGTYKNWSRDGLCCEVVLLCPITEQSHLSLDGQSQSNEI